MGRGQPRQAQSILRDELPFGPLLFPPRAQKGVNSEGRRSQDPSHVVSSSSAASTTARSAKVTAEQENDWKDVNKVECWRRSSKQQRVRAAAVRESIKRLAEDGTQKGIVVDLRTGMREEAFYWIEKDDRVLCVLKNSCSKLEVLPCGSMDIISRADLSKDVAARQFFLGLSEDELRRAVLIVMLASHGQVVPAPLVQPTRVRCLLICADRNRRRLLLEGLTTFQAELLVHSPSSQDPDVTTRGFDEDCDQADFVESRSCLDGKAPDVVDSAQSFEDYLQKCAARTDELNCDQFGFAGSDDSVADSGPSGEHKNLPASPDLTFQDAFIGARYQALAQEQREKNQEEIKMSDLARELERDIEMLVASIEEDLQRKMHRIDPKLFQIFMDDLSSLKQPMIVYTS